jgi:hypothetical protein
MKTMNPNDLGKILVEDCQKISMCEYLSRARKKLKEVLISSELSIFDTPIGFKTTNTGFGGIRHWFECPICGRRAGVLFAHPVSQKIGCRLCLGLEYRKRRYKGMIENSF